MLDPEVGINFATMVHGGQEFEWGEPVCAGDEITTTAKVTEIYERGGKGFYVFESVSTQPGRRRDRARNLDQHRQRASEVSEPRRSSPGRRSPSCG